MVLNADSTLFINPPGTFASAGRELPAITPETGLPNVSTLDPGDIVRIVCYAQAVSEVADDLALLIADKAKMILATTTEKVAAYAAAVETRYRQLLSTLY